jgi:hypothetical protein
VRDDARARGDETTVKRAVAALGDAFSADASDVAHWPLAERLLSHVIAIADAGTHVAGTAPRLIALLNHAWIYLDLLHEPWVVSPAG